MYLNSTHERHWKRRKKFNFNKSCIWIRPTRGTGKGEKNLTLTRVVFELGSYSRIFYNFPFNFNKSCIWILLIDDLFYKLTLFNFNKSCIWIKLVFEYFPIIDKFNFNKCCIWILQWGLIVGSDKLFNFNKCCIWIQWCLVFQAL